MEAKVVFAVCIQLLVLKNTFAQCIGAPFIPEPCGYPGAFTSQLTMSIPALPAPSFSIVADDLVVDGIVSVSGSLPFLGTVTLGGTVPAAGQGTVLYNCGNGDVGIVREVPGARLPIGIC